MNHNNKRDQSELRLFDRVQDPRLDPGHLLWHTNEYNELEHKIKLVFSSVIPLLRNISLLIGQLKKAKCIPIFRTDIIN